MKSLIIGLGNPIMGDDAIGCRCVQHIQENLEAGQVVEVDEFYRGGISLMERLIGYDRVLIIDSIVQPGLKTGSIVSMTLDDLPSQNTSSPHDASLKEAIDFGRGMGEKLPDVIDILAIRIESKYEFSQLLSSEVEKCIPEVVARAREWCDKNKKEPEYQAELLISS